MLVNTAEEVAEALREQVPIIVIESQVQIDSLLSPVASSKARTTATANADKFRAE